MIVVGTVVGKCFATFRANLFLVRFSFPSVFGLGPFTLFAVFMADGFTGEAPSTKITAKLAELGMRNLPVPENTQKMYKTIESAKC